MDSVPVRTTNAAPSDASTHGRNGASRHNGKPGKNKFKLMVGIGGGIALLLIGLLVGWLIYRSTTAATIDGSKYQAVFFNNGQVYFGKLRQVNASYLKLTDVFYLQTQDSADAKNPQDTTTQQSPDVKLVKLGDELHGPDDEMIISKDQIMFFENLKKDGKVSDSIKKYLDQKK